MEEKKKKNKKTFSVIRVLVGVFIFIFLILTFFSSAFWHSPKYSHQMICGANLHQLLIGFFTYRADNAKNPISDQWCDNIQKYFDEEMSESFRCRADKIGPCSYAMNKNIPADAKELPPNLVLLFESAPGWNKTGGPEDVVTDRHDKPGVNIAFTDGRVEFVKPEDIPTLRWTIEQTAASSE